MSTPALPPGLYALIDDGLRPEVPLQTKAKWALDGGAKTLQLRMKKTPLRQALAAAREIVSACRQVGAVCLINDRVDLALLSDAHGAHVGDDDLPVADARMLLGPQRLLGATVRNADGAKAAKAAGADHVGMGPIFLTTTKQVAHPPLGPEGLRREVLASPLPIVAIAGIGHHNIEEVAKAGAHAAAVGSDLLCAADPTERARLLRQAFDAAARGA